MRTFYQSAITDLPTNHLTSWDLGKQLPVEDYRTATDNLPPARLALIKNSFDEQECPSRCWLISKLDQPIDVKREEQRELENFICLSYSGSVSSPTPLPREEGKRNQN